MAKFSSRPSIKDPLIELQGRIEATFRPKAESAWQRLLRRFHATINFVWNKHEHTLAGRIHELRHNADEVVDELKQIYNQLSKELDPRLFAFVQAIIDPLLRDIGPISTSMQSSNAALQAKAFKRYSEWAEKAKIWIDLCHTVKQKDKIILAVVNHLIGESIEMIRRDIQIINDYQEHSISHLPLPDDEKQLLRSELKHAITPYLQKLSDLTALPGTISLEEVSPWRGDIDKRRQKYFELALQTTDSLIEKSFPEFTSEEAQEHLLEVCSQLNFLEEQLENLEEETENHDLSDPSKRRLLILGWISLEEATHRLHLDLRLTPDLVERIQTIMKKIEEAKERIL